MIQWCRLVFWSRRLHLHVEEPSAGKEAFPLTGYEVSALASQVWTAAEAQHRLGAYRKCRSSGCIPNLLGKSLKQDDQVVRVHIKVWGAQNLPIISSCLYLGIWRCLIYPHKLEQADLEGFLTLGLGQSSRYWVPPSFGAAVARGGYDSHCPGPAFCF